MRFATANGNEATPAKVQVQGLLTLSSSNKKKNLSKCFQNKANKNTIINIDLDNGLVKRDSFIKFAINVFQYLLYDKEIIPIPFQYFDRIFASRPELLEESASYTKQLRQKSILSDMFTNLNIVFDFLHQIFEESTIEPSFIAMCLGDSIRFAKEIFSLNLSTLNLFSKSASQSTGPNTRLLTLNYLITTFYKKLLNEASNETDTRKGNSAPKVKSKSTNVIFMMKISSQDVDKFESFANQDTSEPSSSLTANRFQYMYRLGCTITKTTSFALSHHIMGDTGFEIFSDNNSISYDVEEIIEEKLLEEDEENLKKSTLNGSLNESSDSANSEHDSLTKDNSVDSTEEKKPAEEYIWVQIGAPIRCFSKL